MIMIMIMIMIKSKTAKFGNVIQNSSYSTLILHIV